MNTLKTTKINIQDLKPAEYNPRIMQTEEQEKLKQGLTTFGLVDPIIIDLTDNNTVIGGHQRLEVLKEINPDEDLTLIPLGDIGLVIKETDLKIKDKNDQKALNLSLNKIHGDWDYKKRDELLLSLNEDNYNIELTGFDDDDLLSLELEEGFEFGENDLKEDITQQNNLEPNDTEETPYTIQKNIKINVKKGDKYLLGDHVLLCDDSSNIESINKLIGENHINVILTDPPYGMGLNTDYSSLKTNLNMLKTKNAPIHGTNYPKGKVDTFNSQVIENIFNINSDETFLFGANYYTENLHNINDGSWFVWDKRSNELTTIEEAKKSDKIYGSCFELCWSKKKHKQEIIRIKWAGLFGIEAEPDKNKKRIHPTQKPVKLMLFFLNKFIKEEKSNVLDLFGGSGSTLIACEMSNNNCYMMEIDPYYCQVIINRWEEYTGKKAEKIN